MFPCLVCKEQGYKKENLKETLTTWVCSVTDQNGAIIW